MNDCKGSLLRRLLARHSLDGIRLVFELAGDYVSAMAVKKKDYTANWQDRWHIYARKNTFELESKMYNAMHRHHFDEMAWNGILDTTSRWWKMNYANATEEVLAIVEDVILDVAQDEDIILEEIIAMPELDLKTKMLVHKGITREMLEIELDLENANT